MLLATVQISPRARLLLARQTLNKSSCAPVASLIVRQRSKHHDRAFHLGSRRSRTSGSAPRDICKRQRLARHRHTENGNRASSWENSSRQYQHRDAVHRALAGFAKPRYSSPKAQYIKIEEVKTWSSGLSRTRAGSIVGDSERKVVDGLFGKQQSLEHPYDIFRSPLQSQRASLHAWSAPKSQVESVDAGRVIEATASVGPDFPSQVNSIRRASTSSKDSQRFNSSSGRPTSTEAQYADLNEYSPTKYDDPTAARELTAEEKSKNYSDLDKYKPVEWNEPDGLQKPTAEEISKRYTDLNEYTSPTPAQDASVSPAPNGQPALYSDLHEYQPATWNEPDGLPPPTAEEKSKNYDDLNEYGPVKWNEPDGLPGLTPEERSKKYTDLGEYGAVVWNEPNGLQKPTPEEESKNYKDLGTYADGFMVKNSILEAHETEQLDATERGQTLPPKVEVSEGKGVKEEYEDLDKYGPVKWNEPDGLQPLTPEELSKKYEDLDRYAQYDNNGPKEERIHPEEASKVYKDLNKYDQFPNAGASRIHPEEASKQYKDLHNYPRSGFEEPAVTEHVHPEELTKNYEDLSAYRPNKFDAADREYPKHPEEETKAYNDLHLYGSELDSRADSLHQRGSERKTKGLNDYDSLMNAKANTAAASVRHRHSAAMAAAYQPPNAPEGSARRVESGDAEFSSMDESFPIENNGVSPSKGGSSAHFGGRPVVRGLSKADLEKDPYSTLPQGLETSYTEECGGRKTWPTLVRHYTSQREPGLEAPSEARGVQAPYLYKILAYDATTQSISIADTWSSIADITKPYSPAKALLKLANPAKFFPHLAALQQQGFEIVSGRGDVLIFRKIREGMAAASGLTGSTTYPLPKQKRPFAQKLVFGTVGVAGAAYAVAVLGEYFSTSGLV